MKEWETIKNTYKGTQDLLAKYVDAPEELQLIGYIFTYFDNIIRGFNEQGCKLQVLRLMTLENKDYRVEKYLFNFASNWFSVDFKLEQGKSKNWLMRYNEGKKIWEISVHDLIIYYINPEFREFLMSMVQRIKEMVYEHEKRVNALCEKYKIDELLVKRALEEDKFKKR